jgi:hypothetical protein
MCDLRARIIIIIIIVIIIITTTIIIIMERSFEIWRFNVAYSGCGSCITRFSQLLGFRVPAKP